MRRADDELIDPAIAAELDAIDATLAGEPVDPKHAELAELALLLADDRPRPSAEFTRSLDERVSWRFAAGGAEPRRRPIARRSWFAPLAGLATGVAAIAVVVVLVSGGGGSSSGSSVANSLTTPASGGIAGASTAAASSAAKSQKGAPSRTASGSVRPPSSTATGRAPSSATGSAAAPASASSIAGAVASSPAPQPLPNGRKIIQSAQLALSAPPSHIDDVATEVFHVVGDENGVVNSSEVTASSNGYAQFQLSVPSSALQATMSSLSQLRYASVSSRTDATQDVNGQYLSDQRKLADARALRTSLLGQLARATTQAQIDSLTAQIHDAEASISSDEATLRGLNHQINFSQITVTINAAPATVTHRGSGSFTLGKAAHDAGRVLTVAAGVALISLAALTPVALIGALAGWIVVTVRRRRREQALDLA
jgi:Domain of unknown function (DUF4349)